MLFYSHLKKQIFRWKFIGILIIIFTLKHNKVEANGFSDSNLFLNNEFQQEIIKLKINENIVENIIVLRKEESKWYLPKIIFIDNKIDTNLFNFIKYENKEYASISLLEDSKVEFDKKKQELIVNINSKYYIKNNFDATKKNNENKDIKRSGFFINYDLTINGNSSSRSGAVLTEVGKSFDFGVATSNFAYVESTEKNSLIRLDSTLTIDQLSEMSTIRIGDAISRPATILGRPVRYGGIQYSTNFQIQPQFVKTPTANLTAQAALPSTVDIFVNNTLQTRKEIPPGPFSISGVPLISGDGEVRMIITDLAGRQQIISQRFYSSPTLLAKNIREFSIEAGSLRRNFAQESNDYREIFTSGSYRYGLTNNLTIEGGLQIQQGSNFALQTSVTTAINDVGLISTAIGYTNTKFGSGGKFAVGFERNMKNYTIGINTQIAEDGYRQEGIDNEFNVKKIDNINFSYRIKNIGNIGFGFLKQELMSGSQTEIVNANFSTLQRSWGSLFFSAFSSRSDNHNSGISVFWMIPLERNLSSSLSYSKNRSQTTYDQTVFQVQRNIPATNGIGYRLQTGINAPNQIGLSTQNEYSLLRLEAAEFQGSNSLRFGLSGSLANFDNQWFLARRINDSFGLVKIPGMNNVRVYVDNQFAAKTNKEGTAFLPRLYSYIPNKVSVEAADLPMDTEIENLMMSPIPAWRSGVTIDFPIRRSSAATIKLKDETGKFIPVGAVAIINDGKKEYPIGSEGEAYLTDLKEINHVSVRWENQQCSVVIPYKPTANQIADLGDFICKKN
jgi:outer membrane usher protein